MIKNKLYIIICLILSVTLSGCIEEYQADIPTKDSDLLVVEGTICSSKMNTFILSHTKDINSDKELSDDILEMVDDAKVSVRGSDGSVFIADGYYGIYL